MELRVKKSWLFIAAGASCMGLTALALLGRSVSESKQEVARERARQVLVAATDWRSANTTRGCPSLTRLLRDERLAETDPLADPWGKRFRISCNQEDVRILSAGSDGQFSTEDDISLSSSPQS